MRGKPLVRPRNEAARALRDPRFNKRVVANKKTAYTRKGKATRHRYNDGGHY